MKMLSAVLLCLACSVMHQTFGSPTGSSLHRTTYKALYTNESTHKPTTTIEGEHCVKHDSTQPMNEFIFEYLKSMQYLLYAITGGPENSKKVDINMNTNFTHIPHNHHPQRVPIEFKCPDDKPKKIPEISNPVGKGTPIVYKEEEKGIKIWDEGKKNDHKVEVDVKIEQKHPIILEHSHEKPGKDHHSNEEHKTHEGHHIHPEGHPEHHIHSKEHEEHPKEHQEHSKEHQEHPKQHQEHPKELQEHPKEHQEHPKEHQEHHETPKREKDEYDDLPRHYPRNTKKN